MQHRHSYIDQGLLISIYITCLHVCACIFIINFMYIDMIVVCSMYFSFMSIDLRLLTKLAVLAQAVVQVQCLMVGCSHHFPLMRWDAATYDHIQPVYIPERSSKGITDLWLYIWNMHLDLEV